MVSVTIAENRADSGDAIGADSGGGISQAGGSLLLHNSIVAGNLTGSGASRNDVLGGAVASSSFNLISVDNGLTGIANGGGGNQVGTTGTPIDPLLGALQDNGGSVPTRAITFGSPAFGAGSNALSMDTADVPLVTDQRGAGFRRIAKGTVDIGAFELQVPEVIVSPTSSLLTGEDGTTDDFTIVLGVQPASNVVLDVTSGNTGEVLVKVPGAASPVASGQVTFTTSDWNVAQTVQVSGVNDSAADSVQQVTVTISVNDDSSDNTYDPLADVPVTVNNFDDDSATFTVTGDDTSVTEAGSTDTFSVVLGLQPATDVVIDITGVDAGELSLSSTSLTFTNANWDQPQIITATGQDDATVDGDVVTSLTLAVNDAQSDDSYDSVSNQTVAVTTTDDESAGFTIAQTSGTTSVAEPATTDTFTVVLDDQPLSNVVITVVSGDLSEATVSPSVLTFTTATWNQTQTVTVTAGNDAFADGSQQSNITVAVEAGSSDDLFDQVASQIVVVTTVDDEVAGFTVTESGGTSTVSEDLTSDTFTVVLDAQPESNVVVLVTSGDTSEASVDRGTLTFTPTNWDTAQTITIFGNDDQSLDGTQQSTITVAIDDDASADSFDSLADQTVTVTTTDNDVASYTVAETDDTTTANENGTTDAVTVVLDVQPDSNVVFSVSTADGAVSTASPASLTFTPSNWNIQQAVTVAATNDARIDGSQQTQLTVSVNDGASNDAFDPLSDQSVTVTAIDDDQAGFSITEASGTTVVSEAGTTDTFTVVLDAEPASNVEITVSSGNVNEATVDQAKLTFTPGTWDTAQTVTVTGQDDAVIDGNKTVTITLSIVDANSDAAFNAVADQTVSATNIDNDGPGFTISESSGTTSVSEAPTTDTFTVVLDSQPASDVVFTVTSGNLAEATVSPAQLTFTSANFNNPQTVTVTGVNDSAIDGDQTTTITISVDDNNSDDAYDPVADQTVSVTTVDVGLPAVPGITIVESGAGTVVTEAGTTDTFTVVLDAQPAENVALTVVSSDLGEAIVSPSTLTFTNGNWDTPQTVTVTGQPDSEISDGNVTSTITISVDDDASDNAYDSVADVTISVETQSHSSRNVFVLQGRGRTTDFVDVATTTNNGNLDVELRAPDGTVLSPGIGGRISLAGYPAGNYEVWVSDDAANYDITPNPGLGTATGEPAAPALDLDGNDSFAFANDGILLLAFSLGIEGSALEAFRAPGDHRTGAEIQTAIEQLADALDLDADGQFQFANDGILLLAFSLGSSGESLAPFGSQSATRTGPQISARLTDLFRTTTSLRQQTADDETFGVVTFWVLSDSTLNNAGSLRETPPVQLAPLRSDSTAVEDSGIDAEFTDVPDDLYGSEEPTEPHDSLDAIFADDRELGGQLLRLL